MPDKLLEVKHLKKYFNTKNGLLHAVDDVSFDIERGETLGLVGESGCGKSTIGRAILRLHEPTGGEVLLNGVDVTKLNKQELRALRQKMQIVFQDPYSSLDGRKSVFESIGEPLVIQKVCKSKKEYEERVYELMGTVGLAERLVNAYPHELDGGRQCVGIARALALNPEFLVLDEPVSALDVSIQAQVINMFEDLQNQLGVAYLFIAHDLLVVQHISNRIAVMYLGHVVELADANELMSDPKHPYTQSLLSAVPIPDPKTARKKNRIVLEGDVPSPLKMPSGCPFRTRCPYACDKCAESMPDFQEVSAGHFVACHRVGEIN